MFLDSRQQNEASPANKHGPETTILMRVYISKEEAGTKKIGLWTLTHD